MSDIEEMDIPIEVRRMLFHAAGGGPYKIHVRAKREYTRGQAWDGIKPEWPAPYNPWKKCHTENYWVYWRPLTKREREG